MIKYILIPELFFYSFHSYCQVESLKFFSSFSSIEKGIEIKDTLVMQFSNSPWILDRSQISLIYGFRVDSKKINSFLPIYPRANEKERILKNSQKKEKGKRRYRNYRWFSYSKKTGYIDNDSSFFMHSPRENQYVNCQVAPLVEVEKSKLSINETWKTEIIIFKGYPRVIEFEGKLKNNYIVSEKKTVELNGENLSAWKIKATGAHEKLGASTTTFLYKEKEGVLEINFVFYDNSEIYLIREGLVIK